MENNKEFNSETSHAANEQVVPPKKRRLRGALSTILILLAAPLLAILINTYVFQSYLVEGPSMNNNLASGDRLIVLKIERTLSRLTGKNYIPKRGTIVIFNKSSLDFATNGNLEQKQLIKRVIGLPGEHVVVKDGHITVYNSEHPEGFDPDANQSFSAGIRQPTGIDVDLTVGDGEFFVCGDNRQNSLDSRTFGTVKAKDLVGTLGIRLLHGKKTT